MYSFATMSIKKFTFFVVAAILADQVSGHGRLMVPPNRSSMWRKGFNTEPNYTDMGINCGGMGVQYHENGGKCGICGDNFKDATPRANEDGGTFGKGIIVKKYKAGGKLPIMVELTQEHKGYFEFSICNLSKGKETEQCFKRIKLVGGAVRYQVKATGNHRMALQLPPKLKCKRCVLRWHYRGGNNHGTCKSGKQALGCGPQEVFRNCVDISIL